MSEKSSINSYNVLMKAKNDEHAEMKASLEDDWKIIETDDDMPPTAKTTNDKRGRRGYADEDPLATALPE